MISPEDVFYAFSLVLIQSFRYSEREHVTDGDGNSCRSCGRAHSKAHLLELVNRRRQQKRVRMRAKERAILCALVRSYGYYRRVRGNVREKSEEFGRLAGVGDEEKHIILVFVSDHLERIQRKQCTHLADIAQIAM